MNAQSESNLTCVTLTLCDGCLNGCGGECHTPGCALWMNRAPDVPIRNYEVERPCSECDGSGVIETFTGFPGDGPDRDYCDACHGEGVVRFNPSTTVPPDPQLEDEATCPDCHGSGTKENE